MLVAGGVSWLVEEGLSAWLSTGVRTAVSLVVWFVVYVGVRQWLRRLRGDAG